MVEVGQRAGAIRNADSDTVFFFGYGVYKGRVECPILGGLPNPLIELDGGGQVWGCQCWWGSEEKVKEMIGERKVEIVTVSE